jgi:hypothetical protein
VRPGFTAIMPWKVGATPTNTRLEGVYRGSRQARGGGGEQPAALRQKAPASAIDACMLHLASRA